MPPAHHGLESWRKNKEINGTAIHFSSIPIFMKANFLPTTDYYTHNNASRVQLETRKSSISTRASLPLARWFHRYETLESPHTLKQKNRHVPIKPQTEPTAVTMQQPLRKYFGAGLRLMDRGRERGGEGGCYIYIYMLTKPPTKRTQWGLFRGDTGSRTTTISKQFPTLLPSTFKPPPAAAAARRTTTSSGKSSREWGTIWNGVLVGWYWWAVIVDTAREKEKL